MKKFLIVMTIFFALTGLIKLSAFADTPTKNGIYEVPVQLRHAEKDSESMGNSYILHTAILEVKNSKKYITMVSDSTVMNLEFSYYTDGSVSGNVQKAEKVENVKIGEKTYSIGYRFPLNGTGQLVGVKFKAAIMPVSPSARVYIDYENSVLISSAEETSTTAPINNPSSSPTETKPNTSQNISQSLPTASEKNESITEKSSDTIETENIQAYDESALNENSSQVLLQDSESEETTLSSQEHNEDVNHRGLTVGIIIAVIIIAGATAAIVMKKRIKK